MAKVPCRYAVALLLLAIPFSQGRATGERNWVVCGGTPYSGYSGFALCASVTATVSQNASGQYILTMDVYNLSGTNGSYAGTVFTSIGLDNVIPASIDVIADGNFSVTGPCMASTSGCDYTEFWTVTNNKSIGGGVKVDLLSGSFESKYSIASQCGVDDELTPGHNRFFVTDCVAGGADYATIKFRVSGDFDPALTGDLFIKGQNGYPEGRGSTTCLSTNNDCQPTVVPPPPPPTVVPEPITATLVATGMGLWGGLGYFRRRRERGEPG